MKKKFLYALVTAFLFGFPLAAHAQDKGEPPGCDVRKAGLDAAKFFVYLTQDTPYTSWQLWPGKGKFTRGTEPHGAFLTAYVNPVAYHSITGKAGMAFGSLIVVENHDADKKLTDLTVMLKIKGYNPQAGDWHWFQYDPRGKVLAEGRVDICIDCHRSKSNNDFVMTGTATR